MSRDPFKIDGPTCISFINALQQRDFIGHNDEESLACFCGD